MSGQYKEYNMTTSISFQIDKMHPGNPKVTCEYNETRSNHTNPAAFNIQGEQVLAFMKQFK